MAAQFRLFKQRDGKFYFTLVSAQGEELLKSRTYAKICTAESAIELIREAAATSGRAAVEDGHSGKSRVSVRGKTGGLIVVGPKVTGREGATSALRRVQRVAPSAEVVDMRNR